MDDLRHAGGTIADPAAWEERKLPFVHVEWGVAVGDGPEPFDVVIFGPYADGDEIDQAWAGGVGGGHPNRRLVKRHVSDWIEA